MCMHTPKQERGGAASEIYPSKNVAALKILNITGFDWTCWKFSDKRFRRIVLVGLHYSNTVNTSEPNSAVCQKVVTLLLGELMKTIHKKRTDDWMI